MSAFSDEDLKLLREIAEKGMVRLSTEPFYVVACAFRPDQLQALIARLEAAELCARQLNWISNPSLFDSDRKALETWRKAAGK